MNVCRENMPEDNLLIQKNHEAFGNPTSSVEKSFDIALQVLLAGAKTFENRTDSDLS